MSKDQLTRKEIIDRLTKAGKDVAKTIKDQENPAVKLPLRTLSNVYFDAADKLIKLGEKEQSRSFFNVGQSKKFMQTMLVTAQIKELLEQDKPALSTRQLYYILKHSIEGTKENTFDDQATESDPVIEDVLFDPDFKTLAPALAATIHAGVEIFIVLYPFFPLPAT